MAEKGGMISRKECCQFSFTTQYNSFLSLVINYFMFFYYRDKHGRPMSHPDYDPRTLLVSVDICDNVTRFITL